MANDDETVKQVCDKSLRNILDTFGKRVSLFDDIADEIEAAHKCEMAAKDAAIARLRALVGELADALDSLTCRATRCLSEDDPCDDVCFHVKNRSLVDRAREVTK